MRSKELLDQRKWAALRKLLLPRIINVLANEETLVQTWIDSNLLLAPGISLPDDVSLRSFHRGFFKNSFLDLTNGSRVYVFEDTTFILLLHEWKRRKYLCIVHEMHHLNIGDVNCMDHYSGVARDTTKLKKTQALDMDALGRVQSHILRLFRSGEEQGNINNTIDTTEGGFPCVNIPSPKKIVKVVTPPRANGEFTGVDLFRMTRDPQCPLNLVSPCVDRVLASKEAKKSGSIFPRNEGGFDSLAKRNKQELVSIMSNLVQQIATLRVACQNW